MINIMYLISYVLNFKISSCSKAKSLLSKSFQITSFTQKIFKNIKPQQCDSYNNHH